ncbi:hypothetical protein [Comamonas sp. JC664]|uniref:hypothetical protein n=1 Tax=Comamonas sp. JC664 TaxID=2801917 RepID=UPI001748E3F6|nr:hypothetical protein [Comamonas sp. JC664]MBL0693079.1 hypothetical protein [Comamonas sp. JC664]GHG92056.1 hypothetical protein GCM10012319_53560 [Comamonas sp. KCTC 72670]
MKKPLFTSAVAAATLALAPFGAFAGSVFLNGVKIDGVTNQRFEKATVRIDESGNVHIDAPGYAARVTTVTPPAPAAPPAQAPSAPGTPPAQGAPTAAPAAKVPTAPPPSSGPARLTQRYWLVTEQPVPGMTGYDIDVFINSKWLRKLRGNEDQVVMEVTRSLQPGANTVTFIARKGPAGDARSSSPGHVFRVIIGEGNEGGGNVMIDNPLIRFQKTAADTQDATQEFTLTTR